MPNNIYGVSIYKVFADATISIIDTRNGEELLSKGITRVSGSSFDSFNEAGNQALKKLSEQIKKKYLPEITNLLQGE